MGSNEDKWGKAQRRILTSLHLLFTFLYGWAPLVIVPLLAYHYDSWWLLFGILFSYAGAAGQLSVLFAVVAIGFWIGNGFDIRQYLTFFFFCNLWGCLTYHCAEAYDSERRRGTSDSDEERFRRYADEITPQIVQRIKDSQPRQDTYNADDVHAIASVYTHPLSDRVKAKGLQYLKDNPETPLTSAVMQESWLEA